MKFQLNITKEILRKSSKCSVLQKDIYGTSIKGLDLDRNCAFALAYNQLIPNVIVSNNVEFLTPSSSRIAFSYLTEKQSEFILKFDRATPEERIAFPEQSFEVEIPDAVIDYWFKDHVEMAQKIINNPVIKVLETA
jgi:hypothetical protein